MLTLLRLVARLPLTLVHALGSALGWLVYAASPAYRQRLRDNMAAAGFGSQTRRAAIAHAGRMVGELPYLWLRPRDELLGPRLHFAADDVARLNAALAAGRGLVLMTPHLGAFEVCAQAYAERFGERHPMTAMYRPARQAWLRRMQTTARDRPGLIAAPASLAGIRQMMKALRRGEAVGLLPDQVPPEGMGVWAPYFGREAYTMTLAARLVQQTGATPLLMVCERLAAGKGFAVRVRELPEPLPEPNHVAPSKLRAKGGASDTGEADSPAPDPAMKEAADAGHHVACATVINRAMELLVREQPQQYLWGYHRYKQPRRSDAVAPASPAPAA